jgi:hypothetical protein
LARKLAKINIQDNILALHVPSHGLLLLNCCQISAKTQFFSSSFHAGIAKKKKLMIILANQNIFVENLTNIISGDFKIIPDDELRRMNKIILHGFVEYTSCKLIYI